MQVHPTFDTEQKVWITEAGVVAHSLSELQRKLPKAKIIGYYPKGYTENPRPKYQEGDPIRTMVRPSSSYANLSKVNFVTPVKSTKSKPTQEESRLLRNKREYNEINGVVSKDLDLLDVELDADHSIKKNTGWTPELDNKLEHLVNQDFSAGVIATKMGRGLTRNAIIGRCRRKNFKLRRSTKQGD